MICSVDWEYTLDIHLQGANHSFEQVYVTKTKNSKPWISKGILKSIKIKNTLYNKFCRAKDNKLFQEKAKTSLT